MNLVFIEEVINRSLIELYAVTTSHRKDEKESSAPSLRFEDECFFLLNGRIAPTFQNAMKHGLRNPLQLPFLILPSWILMPGIGP